jgi:predicted Zn-dependent peptidase
MTVGQDTGIRATAVDDIQVVSESFPYFHSVALGIAFNLGSRDEQPREQGWSHLIEHMLFKGTRHRTAAEISRYVESLGGTINAHTSRELTVLHAWFPARHFDRVSRLLLELLTESRFAAAELAREKEVVIEEIKSAEENPDDEVWDLAFRAAYGRHAMGEPVGGHVATVRAAESEELRSYYQQRFGRAETVLAAVGEIDHSRLEVFCSRLQAALRPGQADRPLPSADRVSPLPAAPGLQVHERREAISQVYICLAKPALAYPDPRRLALSVLNDAFGAATSSRLFVRLREDQGLVYDVNSFDYLFSDTGLFGVFLITDRRKLARTLRVLKREWNRLAQDGLTTGEFVTARNFAQGMLLLSQEGLGNRLRRLIQNWLLLKRVIPVETELVQLARLKADGLHEVMRSIGRFADLHVGAVGPVRPDELARML